MHIKTRGALLTVEACLQGPSELINTVSPMLDKRGASIRTLQMSRQEECASVLLQRARDSRTAFVSVYSPDLDFVITAWSDLDKDVPLAVSSLQPLDSASVA